MKFLHTHRNDIIKLINNHGWEEQDFSFVKKRGRIHVIHQLSRQYFSYFRKKETTLNSETLQWEHSSFFKIQNDRQPERIVKDWLAVKQEMEMWFNNLS